MSTLILLLVTLHIHQVINTPLGVNEKQKLKSGPNSIPAVVTNHESKHLLVPLVQPQHVTFVDTKLTNTREKKNLPLPVTHHLLVPTNLHVIPLHPNIHHSAIHSGVKFITNDHANLPIVSHSYSHSITNGTHSTPLYLIPVHTHFVPIHDLTVIPLHRPIHSVEQKLSRYRNTMDKRDEEEEPINKFRSFYGGYGNGLYIGGHGAGHGFYAFG